LSVTAVRLLCMKGELPATLRNLARLAAELHRLTDQPSDLIHVTVPWERRIVEADGISLYRSMRIGEMVLGHSNPPRTKIEETVLDLTQTAVTFDDVCGVGDQGVCTGPDRRGHASQGEGPGQGCPPNGGQQVWRVG